MRAMKWTLAVAMLLAGIGTKVTFADDALRATPQPELAKELGIGKQGADFSFTDLYGKQHSLGDCIGPKG